MVLGYPKSTIIPRVDGLSMRPPGFGVSQILIYHCEEIEVQEYIRD